MTQVYYLHQWGHVLRGVCWSVVCLHINTTAQFFMKILPEIRKFTLHFGSSSASGSEFRNFLKDFFSTSSVSAGNGPQYFVDCCKSTTDVASRQRLHSTSRHQLIVPRYRRTKFGRRAFSVAGPTASNSLPDYLRDPSLSEDTFGRSLKTHLFALY